MNKLQAEQLLTSLVAAHPQVSLEPASVELYTAALQEMDYEAGFEAVRMLIRGSSRFPAIADIRELYTPIRRRLSDERAKRLGLAEPPRAVPPPEALEAIRRLGKAWGSEEMLAFADRMTS